MTRFRSGTAEDSYYGYTPHTDVETLTSETGNTRATASGDYDMGSGDYNSQLNRFLARDSYNGALADLNLGTSPWTGNRYAFTAGNPVSFIERDGHEPRPWHDHNFNADTFDFHAYQVLEEAAFARADARMRDQEAKRQREARGEPDLLDYISQDNMDLFAYYGLVAVDINERPGRSGNSQQDRAASGQD